MSKLMSYLPDLYQGVREFEEIMRAEQVELDAEKTAIDRLLKDQFVLTASERAIKRREAMIGIQSDSATETLDFRRRRLINRYSTKPPFTIRFLQNRLDYLVGAGRTVASVDPQQHRLLITTSIDDALLFREVEHTVKNTIPANLHYQQDTALGDRFGIEEHIRTQTLTRNTRLSTTWRLGVTPLATAGPEVVLK